jgi:hypothetical protein
MTYSNGTVIATALAQIPRTVLMDSQLRRTVVILLVLGFSVIGLPFTLHADVIVDNVPNPLGTSFTPASFGQSVTTPSGGPWNLITFGFYNAPVPLSSLGATGTLFLLDQSYSGTPSALNSLTPGFLASTSSIGSDGWQFAPTLTLQSSTEYFFYMNSTTGTPLLPFMFTGVALSGGQGFRAATTGAAYAGLTSDLPFRLQGTPVPEPATATSLITGLFALAGVCIRLAKVE